LDDGEDDDENENDDDDAESGIGRSSLRSGNNGGKDKEIRRNSGKSEGKSASHAHHDFFSGQSYPDDFLAKPRLKQKSRRRDSQSTSSMMVDVTGLIKDEDEDEEEDAKVEEGEVGDGWNKKKKARNESDEQGDDDSSTSSSGGGGRGGRGREREKERDRGARGRNGSGGGNGGGSGKQESNLMPGPMTLKIRRSVSPKATDSNVHHDAQNSNFSRKGGYNEDEDEELDAHEQNYYQDDGDNDDEEYDEDGSHNQQPSKRSYKGVNPRGRKPGNSSTYSSSRGNGSIVFTLGGRSNGDRDAGGFVPSASTNNNHNNNSKDTTNTNTNSAFHLNSQPKLKSSFTNFKNEDDSVISAFAKMLQTSNSLAAINEARTFLRANSASFANCNIDVNQILELLNAKWCIDNAIALLLKAEGK
jgi:hypothetical protein